MPRNVSGTYSLFTPGNPVVPSTVITTTWANNTLADIATALTDSLSRSGNGGMSASLKLIDGVVAAPGLSWANETTSGLYRAAAGDFRYSISGVDALNILANQLLHRDGSAAAPGLSFLSDTNTGLYRIGADSMGFTAGGSLRVTIDGAGITLSTGNFVMNADGAAATPSYTFASDLNTGMYSAGADAIGWSTNGVSRLSLSTTALTSTLPLLGPDGLVGTPAVTFSSDPDTGLYHIGANRMGIAIGGVRIFDMLTSLAEVTVPLYHPDGTPGAPSFTFSSDTNTGMYSGGADDLRLATGGTFRQNWGTLATTLRLQTQTQDGTVSLPAYAFESDPDTGVYRIGANNLGFAEGGTGYQVGFRSIPVSSTTTTLVATDVGRCVPITANIAIPASVFAAGDVVSIYNNSAGALSITIAAGTLRLGGTTSTGTRTLAPRGMATIWVLTGGATPEVIATGSGLT